MEKRGLVLVWESFLSSPKHGEQKKTARDEKGGVGQDRKKRIEEERRKIQAELCARRPSIQEALTRAGPEGIKKGEQGLTDPDYCVRGIGAREACREGQLRRKEKGVERGCDSLKQDRRSKKGRKCR